MLPGKPAWSYYSVNPRRCGTVFAIDGRETWLVHNHLNPDEPEFDSVDRDCGDPQDPRASGADSAYEVISKEDWVGRRLVADRFRDRNVFIAGDAAHLWVPYAGYGMNAGIADALEPRHGCSRRGCKGWGDEGILDAYEAERQPITEQVSQLRDGPRGQDDQGAPGGAGQHRGDASAGGRRGARIGEEAYELNVQQFCCAGLNFGYFYDGSPIIVARRRGAAGHTRWATSRRRPSPGCRAPHFWLADGRSLYDAFGAGYTLLRFDRRGHRRARGSCGRGERSADGARCRGCGCARGVSAQAGLVPDDQHVAWRGDDVPTRAGDLIDTLRGATPP